MFKNFLLLLFCVSFLTQCNNPQDPKADSDTEMKVSTRFDLVLENFYQEGLKLDPLKATYLGDPRYNDLFPNYLSDEYAAKVKTFYKAYRDTLSKFDNDGLSKSQRMSKDLILWESNMHLEKYAFNNWKYFPIDQMWTLNLAVGQLAGGVGAQPFETVTDYRNWLQRVDGYLVWLETAEANMREGIKNGYVLPQVLIKKIVPQLKAMMVSDLDQNLFYSPAEIIPEHFSEKAKEELKMAFAAMVTEKIIPAYTSLYTFMSTEYLDAGRTSTGIEAIPDGAAYYAHQIKRYTTTNMTAEEIHKLGLREVKRITKEMEKVKNKIGFKGDLKEFFAFVRNDKDLMPYTMPQQIIDHFYAIYDRMKPQLEVLFDQKPKTAFEVRQTEAFRENSASAEYNSGSLDGTRPGIFYVPIPDASAYNVYADESLFLHEAIPGHHYQISLTQENTQLPKFRKTLYYSGYGEGWALYCESLGKELGLYTDPFQYFGMLSQEMHRAIRLVIDTGMHTMGWSREKAIQYSLNHEADSKASIIAEVERYMANPGQALAYKIGQLKIKALRDEAEKALGDRFDIAEFHNEILETGCIPLNLLEKKIELWIAEKTKA